MPVSAVKDPQRAIGRAPERLNLDERLALTGKYIALEIYTPEALPLRRIEAIGDSVETVHAATGGAGPGPGALRVHSPGTRVLTGVLTERVGE